MTKDSIFLKKIRNDQTAAMCSKCSEGKTAELNKPTL